MIVKSRVHWCSFAHEISTDTCGKGWAKDHLFARLIFCFRYSLQNLSGKRTNKQAQGHFCSDHYVDFCSPRTSGDKHTGLLLEAIAPATKTPQLLPSGWEGNSVEITVPKAQSWAF